MGNRDWLDRSLKAVWHPCTQMKLHDTGVLPLVPVARGQGAWLYDFDGQRYLDAISSWWVNLFGHAHPRIGAAVKDQLDRLEQVIGNQPPNRTVLLKEVVLNNDREPELRIP